jgi:tetratricopeptide (TPR) repeat protein
MEEHLRQLMHLAREHYQNHEYDKAEPLLLQIVRDHRGFADMFNMLGVIQHGQERLAEAQQMFEEALKVNPGYTEAALNLAVTYNDLGKYAEAKEVYAQAIAASRAQPRHIDPFAKGKIANLHAHTADAYAGLGLNAEAAREYRKALELCPSFVDIRSRLAATLRDLGDKEAAIQEYQTVKQQAPHYLQARVNLGVALYSVGRRDEARQEWEAVLAEEPDNKSCRMYLDILKS